MIADPYRPAPDGSRWKRLGARLADPATWKDLVFLLLQLPLGIVSFVVAITVLATGLAGLTAPLWFWAVPGGIETGRAGRRHAPRGAADGVGGRDRSWAWGSRL